MRFNKEIRLATHAAFSAGEYLRQIRKAEVIVEEGKDIKLRQDKKSEEIIFDYLSKTSYPIVSEETKRDFIKNRTSWIVDPLDGSFNFYRGIPNCAISIALWDINKPLLGVIYDFNRRDFYYGVIGLGAFLNNKRIHVSSINKKSKSVLYTGFPSNSKYLEDTINNFGKEVVLFKKVRLIGSAALSLAYIASGRGELYHEKGIMPWDVAAGLALVKFAGGKFQIEELDEDKYDVWASNGKIIW
ncbi:MAG: inositol monophosphatase family protein [Candidatus Pacearchaeota archaeon]